MFVQLSTRFIVRYPTTYLLSAYDGYCLDSGHLICTNLTNQIISYLMSFYQVVEMH